MDLEYGSPAGLFVYGTLMPHKTNRFKAITDVTPTKVDWGVIENFMLYRLTSFPAVVPMEGTSVFGEVILFDDFPAQLRDQILASLDRYEGEPYLYKRTTVTVKRHKKEDLLAWVYIYNQPIEGLKEGTLINAHTQNENPLYAW
jgi:gamma-glutamylcyclotransferase (GGCT)/AIG2-like uncharacterized protein YtfP